MPKVFSSLQILLLFFVLGLSGCQFSKVDPDEAARKQQEDQQRQKDKEQAEKSFSEKMTFAIQQNDLKAFEALIGSVGVADLQVANENGEMWFHEVLRKDRYHFAAALIAKGLSVFKTEERSGLSPLELAKKSSHAEMLALLEAAAKSQFQEIVQLLEIGQLQKALDLQMNLGVSLEYRHEGLKTLVAFVLQNISAYKKADMAKLEEFVLSAPSLTPTEFNQLFESKSDFSEGFLESLIATQSFGTMGIQEKESFLLKAYETSQFGSGSRDLILKSLADLSASGAKAALSSILTDLQSEQRNESEFLQGLQILGSSKNAGLITSFEEMKSLIIKINQATLGKLSDLEKTSELLLKMLSGDLAMGFSKHKDLQSMGSLGQAMAQKILVADRISIESDFFQSATMADRAPVFDVLKQFSANKQKVLAPQAAQLLRLAKDQADYDLIFDRVLVEPSILTQEQWLQQLIVILEKRWANTSGLTDLFSSRASFLLNEERWKNLEQNAFHVLLDKEARFVVIGELDARPAQVFRAMVQARGRKMTDGLVLRFGTQDYHISNYSFFIAVHLARSASAASDLFWARFEQIAGRLEVSLHISDSTKLRLFWNDLKILSTYSSLPKQRVFTQWERIESDIRAVNSSECMSRPFGFRGYVIPCFSLVAKPAFETFESTFSREFMAYIKYTAPVGAFETLNKALVQLPESDEKVQNLILASIAQLKDLSRFTALPGIWKNLKVGLPTRDGLPLKLISDQTVAPFLGHNATAVDAREAIESLKFAILKTSPRLVYAIANELPGIMDWSRSRSREKDFFCGDNYQEVLFLNAVDRFISGIKRSDLTTLDCASVEYNKIIHRETTHKVRRGDKIIEIPLVKVVDTPEDARNLVRVLSGSEYQWIMFLQELDAKREQLHPLAVQWLDSLPRFLFEK